jgi:Cu+-exporting ATPase
MSSISLPLKNMHCASCASLVQATLEDMSGVQKVRVEARHAEVEYDPQNVKPEQFATALKEIGHS